MILSLKILHFRTTYPQRAHHVESTSIRRGYYVETSKTKFRRVSTSFPCTFSMQFGWSKNPRRFHVLFSTYFADQKIHVISTYFFRCNFDGGKIHNVFTYSFRCNFDGQKIYVASTYFFQRNFDGRNMTLFLRTFFDVILMGKNSTSFLVSCKLMKTFEKVFLWL